MHDSDFGHNIGAVFERDSFHGTRCIVKGTVEYFPESSCGEGFLGHVQPGGFLKGWILDLDLGLDLGLDFGWFPFLFLFFFNLLMSISGGPSVKTQISAPASGSFGSLNCIKI